MMSAVERDAVVCREGQEQDRCFMVDLAGRVFADFGDYSAIIDQWLSMSQTQSFVLVQGTTRLGFSLLARERPLGFWRSVSAELVAIVLASEARGLGLGKQLLMTSEAQARQWKASEIRLHTAQTNTLAQEFFHAAGYQVYEGRAVQYPNGEPAVAMHRELDDVAPRARGWRQRSLPSSSR